MGFRPGRVIGALAAAGLAVSACASVIEGRSQHIFISTNPAGADCGFYREGGMRIATLEGTPGSALVEKTKTDIWIVCVKPGYEQATFVNHSGVAGSAFVNIIGGIFTLGISTAIGIAVDSSNGSDNKYESPVNVTMIPTPADRSGLAIALPQIFNQARAGQPADAPSAVTGGVSRDASYAPPTPAPATPSRPLEPGAWVCGIDNPGGTSGFYTVHFAIADDRTIMVGSFGNAPATIVRTDPLTFAAVNPRGSRLTTFTLKPDNSMIVTGPGLNNPSSRFFNTGTCARL